MCQKSMDPSGVRNGGWTIVTFSKSQIVINGITFPSFGWAWLAFNLGSGMVAGLAGILFKVIGIFFGGGGPSMEQLLQKQLEEIRRLISEAFLQNNLQLAAASMDNVSRLMRQYMQNPSEDFRIKDAILKSSETISNLKSLDFYGYQLYMSAATLHLAILDEFCHVANDRANYLEAIDEFTAYHRDWEARIASDASFNNQAIKYYERHFPFSRYVPGIVKVLMGQNGIVETDVLGTRASALPRYNENSAEMQNLRMAVARDVYKERHYDQDPPPNYQFTPLTGEYMAAAGIVHNWLKAEIPRISIVDWPTFRNQKEEATVNYGAVIVGQWNDARRAALIAMGGSPQTASLPQPDLVRLIHLDGRQIYGLAEQLAGLNDALDQSRPILNSDVE